MNKFPYSRGKKFIPWKNDICPCSSVFIGLKAQLLVQSGPNHHKNTAILVVLQRQGNGRWMGSPFWRHQWRSSLFISHAYDVKREICVYPVVTQLETGVIKRFDTTGYHCFHTRSEGRLTNWGRDKINTITQTTFSSGFSWMKMFDFRLKFHWSLILRI